MLYFFFNLKNECFWKLLFVVVDSSENSMKCNQMKFIDHSPLLCMQPCIFTRSTYVSLHMRTENKKNTLRYLCFYLFCNSGWAFIVPCVNICSILHALDAVKRKMWRSWTNSQTRSNIQTCCIYIYTYI